MGGVRVSWAAMRFERLVGLVEAGVGLGQQVQVGVRLGKVGEDLGDMLGKVLAGDLQRSLAQADREQVLLTLGADLGHVGERDGVEASRAGSCGWPRAPPRR